MKKQDFNQEWIFYKENSTDKERVRLPHDAMILEARNPESPSGSAGAFFPGGIYYYEKKFVVPTKWQDKHMELVFDGVYRNAEIMINGQKAGGRAYGYIPFSVSLDQYIRYGEENTILVKADNSEQPNSRWYSGSGIYRPVWLYVGEKHHIKHEGVKITTLSYQPAKIRVETLHTGGEVVTEISYREKMVASAKGDDVEIEIPDAKLWDEHTPELYTCHVTLHNGDNIIDEVTETFGIRKVEWGAQGLFINGKETLLRGGCVHHDNGLLGARCYEESEDRRVRIMKQAGYNAIRSSHYPISKEMLRACDTHGMYVMDETWDMWYQSKTKYDYANYFEQDYCSDMKAMIEKDYNHPSVIMYSIGNEVTEPVHEKGLKLAKEMVAYVKSLDTSRGVTCGLNLWLLVKSSKGSGVYDNVGEGEEQKAKTGKTMNSTVFNLVASKMGTAINNGAKSRKADLVTSPVLSKFDICGYNYSSGRYPLDGSLHPERIIVGSETYPQDICKNWEMVKQYPYLIGDFVWTSWDYLGEVGLGAWAYTDDAAKFDKPYPWLLADCGTIDILGNIGAQADYAAIIWGVKESPVLHVRPVNHKGQKPIKMVWRGTDAMPSWSWRNCEGNKAMVEVYSNADYVELKINEKSLGRKRVKDHKVIFKVKYVPGTLSAIDFDANGKELGKSELKSAKGRTRISAVSEKEKVVPDEVAYVNVSLKGENDVIESNHDRKLKVEVAGGELLAFGSANPRTEESFNSGEYSTYYGRAQVIVRAGNGKTVQIKLTDNEGMEEMIQIPIEQ